VKIILYYIVGIKYVYLGRIGTYYWKSSNKTYLYYMYIKLFVVLNNRLVVSLQNKNKSNKHKKKNGNSIKKS